VTRQSWPFRSIVVVYHGGKAKVSEIVGRTHHLLVSAWGRRWRQVEIAMFTIFVDDSGTSPSQRVAVAAALLIPAGQILRLEKEWNALKEKEKFSSFHMSEFVANNRRSEFANWDGTKKQRVFNRVLQISKKYGIQSFSFTVHKKDYEETVSGAFRDCVGRSHYTWCVNHLIGFIEGWRSRPPIVRPVEYIFDWMEPKDERRIEIQSAMAQAEYFSKERGLRSDGFSNYSFRRRETIPGLQCVDVIGWTSYQYGLHSIFKTPLQPFAQQSWKHFKGGAAKYGWLQAVTVTKANLQNWVNLETGDGSTLELFRKWQAL
jgi:Protein of unknown function (DUF3800)